MNQQTDLFEPSHNMAEGRPDEIVEQSATNKPIRPAATVLILRDVKSGEQGVEVLTMRRSASMRFLPGHLAFPGGSLQVEDEVIARQRSRNSLLAAERDDDVVYAVGAIRETAEEIGCLLTLQTATGNGVDTQVTPELQAKLLQDEGTLLRLMEANDWWVDMSKLRFVGRWVTPSFMPARFDTRFFVVDGTSIQGELNVHESENEWAKWCKPGQLLDEIEAGRQAAVPPTIAMLKQLADVPSVASCLTGLSVPGPTHAR